ncbi:terminase large subunit [Bacillus phage Belinda]|uniref:terminase large subunit n=1 Tax=Bacillus phage Belinda TaxID=1852564 RepID=UPI0007F127AC|nr:terminase large subunit [Bacillus phage Belinda]ANM46000.1 terminase large subunit [Bacillus phage Belinda]AOZ62321.1 terminase large subunit [Bacillus phage SBP8a]
MSNITGELIQRIAKQTFGRTDLTKEELTYILTMVNCSSYLLKNHSVKSHPITFHVSGKDAARKQAHRPWQVDIINDTHPDKAVIKSRQLGLSEVGVGEMMHFADIHSYAGVKCLYTFPTNRQMKDFVSTRINPLLASGYYGSITDPYVDSLDKKKIRNSFLIFRSSSKAAAVEGIDIDYLSMDEYDRVPASAEQSAIESMASSQFKIMRRWSTPTVPNYGIHKLFEESDQRIYMHKCDACNYTQEIDYDLNVECLDPSGVDTLAKTVRDGTYRFICQKCKAPLDRWYNGLWVPRYADRSLNNQGKRGYLISQLNAVWLSADDIKRKEINSESKQHFYNYVLGFPYQDVALAVQPDDVFGHKREYLPKPLHNRGDYRFISVGIDWGNRHWVTIRGFRDDGRIDLIRMFSIERARGVANIEADLWQVINEISPYQPDIICADIGDSGNYVDKLIQHFGEGVAYGVKVNPNPRSTGQIVPVWSENRNMVTVDKLTQNKKHIADMKMGRLGFYQQEDQLLKLYLEHWQNVVIRDEQDEKTKEMYQVIMDKGPDHFAQSSVYSMVGMEHILEPYIKKTFENAFDYTALDVMGTSAKPDIFEKGW